MIPGFEPLRVSDIEDPQTLISNVNRLIEKLYFTASPTIAQIDSVPTDDDIEEGHLYYYESGATKRMYFKADGTVHFITVDS